MSIKNYVQRAMTAAETDAKTEKKDVKQRMQKLERACIIATSKLVKFIKGGGVPKVETATSFRYAAILLPNILARAKEHKCATKTWTAMTIRSIDRVLGLAKSNPKLPTPLSDPQLESTRAALKEYKEVYCKGSIRKMEVFINIVKNKANALEPDHIAATLEELPSGL